jgi:hypothetical protein
VQRPTARARAVLAHYECLSPARTGVARTADHLTTTEAAACPTCPAMSAMTVIPSPELAPCIPSREGLLDGRPGVRTDQPKG